MNEFFARNRLSSYIDGDLSPKDMHEMDLVVRDNLEVRTDHADMVRAVELIDKEGSLEPPEGLLDEIITSYLEVPPAKSMYGRLFGVLMLLLLGGLIALAVGYYSTRGVVEQVIDISREVDLASEAAPEPREFVEALPSPVLELEEEEQPLVVADEPTVVAENRQEPRAQQESVQDVIGPQAELDLTSTDEWEELWEGSGARDDGVLTVPSSYRFYAVDSGSLIRIASLARGSGGSLISRNGDEFEVFRMSTERNFSNFLARIPSESVESFLGELQLLGSLSVVPSEGIVLAPNGNVELGVQVQYAP